jgi:hypothetical protein
LIKSTGNWPFRYLLWTRLRAINIGYHGDIAAGVDDGKTTMKKLSLRDWAAISEIVAAVAVIVSLVFVVLSINRNTMELQAQNINDLYDSLREIETTVLADAELAEIVRSVEAGAFDSLSEKEAFRYTIFMVQHLSIWEQMHARKLDGSVSTEIYADWREYFTLFARQYLPQPVWERRKAWFTDPGFQAEVESALTKSKK